MPNAAADPLDTPLTEADVERLLDRLGALRAEVGKVIVGQQETVEHLLVGLLAGGHCLLEGVPGLAKTLMVRTLGAAMHLTFKRVQFTPDLMPSDIVGTEILEEDHGTGRRVFRFQRGPVFTHLLLADEINRSPPASANLRRFSRSAALKRTSLWPVMKRNGNESSSLEPAETTTSSWYTGIEVYSMIESRTLAATFGL
jgi:hypothetical protein